MCAIGKTCENGGTYVQSGRCDVLQVGLYFNGLLEHHAKRFVRSVAAESGVVLSEHGVVRCDLNKQRQLSHKPNTPAWSGHSTSI